MRTNHTTTGAAALFRKIAVPGMIHGRQLDVDFKPAENGVYFEVKYTLDPVK
ncbi:MAG: hypothetical protein ACLQNE_33520 [Thermoguttaceae bacterium]